MASRYLRASGNWNGAVWASTSGGVAGSASVPTIDDVVFMNQNFNVSLSANADCSTFNHERGSLSLNSYTLTCKRSFQSYGTLSRTINLNTGTLIISDPLNTQGIAMGGSNLSFNAGSSKVILQANSTQGTTTPSLGSYTFNDFLINMGNVGGSSSQVDITGSPTFNALIILSKNSAAHTVNFVGDDFTTDRFIAIGSSTTNRLSLRGSPDTNAYTQLIFTDGATCYGQFLDLGGTSSYGGSQLVYGTSPNTPLYVGANSIDPNDNGWLLQDAPKISTLIDPLTTAPGSNANWMVTGLVSNASTGKEGGGYSFSASSNITSTDTFDLVDSVVIFENANYTDLSDMDESAVAFRINTEYDFEGSEINISDNAIGYANAYGGTSTWWAGSGYAPPPLYRFVKIALTAAGIVTYSVSNNGTNWTQHSYYDVSEKLDLFRSVRLEIGNSPYSENDFILGSINPDFNASPTTSLTSPVNAAALTTVTPTLTFAATDPEGDAVTYEVQIDDNSSFTSPASYLSASDPGFSGTNPYASGSSVTYTVQDALTAGGLTYYWRVRAKDPSGSNTWGTWSSTRTMITEATAPSVTTGSASSITQTTATAAGNVTADNGASITERGVVYSTSTNPTTANGKKTTTGTTGALSANLTGLSAGTLYHFRAYAINSKGTSYGSDQTFTTMPQSANITSIYDITYSDAEVDVTVPTAGGVSVSARGVVYSSTTGPTLSDSVVTSGSGTGSFTASITGLTGSTTYYARPYTTNSQGTTYGAEVSFTTAQPPSAPTVVTGAAANTTDITSEFNGSEVTMDGTQTVTERGIVFSDTNTTPDTDDRKIVAPAGGLGAFNLGITGLEPETTYYVRAYAKNSIGTGYGSVVTFMTEAPFVPDEGDGYWTWTPSGSDAVVGRSQSTQANSSVDLMLADLGLEDGETYTLYYGEKTNVNGETKMVLQWYEGAIKTQQLITPGTPFTFTYDETFIHWAIRLFVTGASVEADDITATFSDMYLAKETEFSGYVPFIPKGVTEVKIENNWLIDKQRSDVITTMFDSIEGLSWHPFKIQTEGLGWFEIGDRFTIQDNAENEYSVVMWNSKLSVDGSISETLFTEAPDITETNYNKAGKLGGLWKRTQIEVDKNKQEIAALVEDVYDFDGVINTKFTEIYQDVNQVRTTGQGSGGVNLIMNSVMYAFDTDNLPEKWAVTGTGTLLIQASNESLAAGAVAGNAFTLQEKTVTQRVTVRKDVDFIQEDDKTYYSISAKVKKNTVGTAHIKLINRNETLTIDLPDQTSYYWDTVKIEEILPKDDYFDVEIYSDDDADLQVTDLILAPGKTKREWSQANGEVMNSSVTITEEGMTLRSPQFPKNYTKIDALGFEVHRQDAGGDRVFGFNDDETNVAKLKADQQISMAPLRTVPIDYGTYKGWAFTLSEDN